MGKIYSVKTNQDIQVNNYCAFNSQQYDIENSSTYFGVLNILRKAFNLADFSFLIKDRNNTM